MEENKGAPGVFLNPGDVIGCCCWLQQMKDSRIQDHFLRFFVTSWTQLCCQCSDQVCSRIKPNLAGMVSEVRYWRVRWAMMVGAEGRVGVGCSLMLKLITLR